MAYYDLQERVNLRSFYFYASAIIFSLPYISAI